MVNHTFHATQLRTAQAAISRALQAVEADQVGADPPHVPTREDLRAALAADGLAELHGTHRPGDHADAAPPRSCQCNDPTVICPVHPRGPTAAELLAPAAPFPAAFTTPATDAAVRAVFARKAAADLPAEPPDPLARSMALAMTIQRQVEQAKMIDEVHARVNRVEKILLAIDRDACARQDLIGF